MGWSGLWKCEPVTNVMTTLVIKHVSVNSILFDNKHHYKNSIKSLKLFMAPAHSLMFTPLPAPARTKKINFGSCPGLKPKLWQESTPALRFRYHLCGERNMTQLHGVMSQLWLQYDLDVFDSTLTRRTCDSTRGKYDSHTSQIPLYLSGLASCW